MSKRIEGIIKESFLIKDGSEVYWPSNDKYSKIDASTKSMKKLNMHYCPNEGLVGFVFDNQLFVTPYRKGIFKDLESFGFKYERQFYVPLSCGEQPVGELAKAWDHFKSNNS